MIPVFLVYFTSNVLLPKLTNGLDPVSYTHLDVYKRQVERRHSKWAN